MKKLTLKIAVVLGVALLVATPLTVAAADPIAEDDTAEAPASADCSEFELDVEDLTLAQFDPEGWSIVPRHCLSGQVLTCASLPIPVGGSCSCTSRLLNRKCRVCETGHRGQVVETTCTVQGSCSGPYCDLNQNFSRTGLSCGG